MPIILFPQPLPSVQSGWLRHNDLTLSCQVNWARVADFSGELVYLLLANLFRLEEGLGLDVSKKSVFFIARVAFFQNLFVCEFLYFFILLFFAFVLPTAYHTCQSFRKIKKLPKWIALLFSLELKLCFVLLILKESQGSSVVTILLFCKVPQEEPHQTLYGRDQKV